MQSFDVFFDLFLNEWLSKQSWGWLFITPSRHYDVTVMSHFTSASIVGEDRGVGGPGVGGLLTKMGRGQMGEGGGQKIRILGRGAPQKIGKKRGRG